jgi:hypothetical protein
MSDFLSDYFEERPYMKCIFNQYPKLLMTDPQKKFFRRVKDAKIETLEMARGPIFECRECGWKYIYTVMRTPKGKKVGVMYTPVGQHARPKWVEDMPAGSDCCSGGTTEYALVWLNGKDPEWDATRKVYTSWVGGKVK